MQFTNNYPLFFLMSILHLGPFYSMPLSYFSLCLIPLILPKKGGSSSALGGASFHGVAVRPRAPPRASALHSGRGVVLPGHVTALGMAGTEP